MLVALGAAALIYFNSEGGETYFNVNGQKVPESQLPSLGYRKINGQWWSAAQIAAAANQAGIPNPNVATSSGTTNTTDPGWAIVSNLLATGVQYLPLLLNSLNGGSGTGMN